MLLESYSLDFKVALAVIWAFPYLMLAVVTRGAGDFGPPLC
jgi:hypothetical protein